MSDKERVEEIRKEMKKLAEEYEKGGKISAKDFMQRMDELTREYYRLEHPELNKD